MLYWHPAEGPGLKPIEFIGFFQGAEAPCSLRKARTGVFSRRVKSPQRKENRSVVAAAPALRPSRDYPSEQRRSPGSPNRGPFRGLAVDAGVRGCAEVRSHISEARCGAPSFGEGVRCVPPGELRLRCRIVGRHSVGVLKGGLLHAARFRDSQREFANHEHFRSCARVSK